MAQTVQSGDSVNDLLRKLLLNQAGPQAPQSGDGERDLYRKILINQADQINSGSSWTTP